MVTIDALCQQLAQVLSRQQWMLATAESCTGGLVAAACTNLAGSSQWFERGFVTYTNAAKTQLLGVPADLIATHGAVSQPVAVAMAQGACQQAGVQVGLSTTGIAGPAGGSEHKPVGTVCFAWCIQGQTTTETQHFSGDRAQVRQAAVQHSLQGLLQRLSA